MNSTNAKTITSSFKTNSQISHTSSTFFSEEESIVHRWQESLVFPLFSEIARVVNLPPILYLIQVGIEFLQAVGAYMYLGNKYVWRYGPVPKLLKYLSYLINLGLIEFQDDNFNGSWPIYITVITFFVLQLILVGLTILWYRRKRSFAKWMLSLIQLVFGVINPILLISTCGIAGYAVAEINRTQSVASIFCLLISIIPAIGLFFLVLLNYHFTCDSVYLSRSIIALWDCKIMMSTNLFIALGALLAPLCNAFSNWFVFVGFFINFIGIAHHWYLLFFFPIIDFLLNTVIYGMGVYGISAVAMTITRYFIDVNIYASVLTPFAFLLVGNGIILSINIKRRKKILEPLQLTFTSTSTSTSKPMTENEIKEVFDSINFLNSDEYMLCYVRLGVANMAPSCVDFSFMKYLIENRPTVKILYGILQIASFFPAQMQFMSRLLSIINKINNTNNTNSIFHNFLLYQAKKIHVIRQSSVSKEAQAESIILTKMSEETISLVRGFWGEISHAKNDISTASLRYFRNATMRTNSAFLDALDQYPKSQIINDQYIRFLIEAMGDYENAVKFTKRLMYIEQGRQMINDFAFRSFCHKFPKYLNQGILDLRGMYTQDRTSPTESALQESFLQESFLQESAALMNSSTSEIKTENMNGQFDEIVSQIFDHSKLRLSLQSTIGKTKMPSFFIADFLSLFNVFVVFIVCIALMSALTLTTETPMELMKSNTITSKIASVIQYGSLVTSAIMLEVQSGGLDLSLVLCRQLSITLADLPQFPSVFYKPYVALNQAKNVLSQSIEDEMSLIFSNYEKHKGEVEMFSDWIKNNYVVAFDLKGAALSFRGCVNLFINQLELLSSFNKPANINNYLATYIQVINNGFVLSSGFSDIFQNVTQSGIDNCESSAFTISIIMYTISALMVTVFLLFRLYNFYCIHKDIKKISNLLKGINIKDIEKSKEPIYLKSKNKLPTGTVHSAHDFSIEIYLLPIVIIVSILIAVFFALYSGLNYVYSFNFVMNAFKWSNDGAQRSSSIMYLLLAVIIEQSDIKLFIGLNTNETIGDNFVRNIKSIFKLQKQLDLAIIGNNNELDDFYYKDSAKCKTKPSEMNFARYIDCVSLSNKINIAINYYNMMNKEYDGRNKIFYSPEFSGISFIVDKYIYHNLQEFNEYLLNYTQQLFDQMNNTTIMMCLIGMILIVLIFSFEYILVNLLNNAYAGFKQLIYALPPTSVVQNHQLMDFLTNNKNHSKNFFSMTIAESVMFSSDMSILNINANLVVQNINPAFTRLTGLAPDQILGQSIAYLVPLPTSDDINHKVQFEKSPFYLQLEEMKNREKSIFTLNTQIKNYDCDLIPVRTTLVKKLDEFNQFDGITIMFHDLTEDKKLKKALKHEREKTLKLLGFMAPRGSYKAIKGKKQPVLFSAEKAAIIFIEIFGLSDCVSTMTPKDLMRDLDLVFSCFDEAISKYPSISMMRTESDMIFAVSGLFDHIGDLQTQSNEVAGFLIEILRLVDDLNVQINTDFHLCVGAHIGGPVVGNVMKPDAPCFEFLSKSIRIASYMQNKGESDHAQITESIVNHLDLNVYNVEKKYELNIESDTESIYFVTLKKGKTTAAANDRNEDNVVQIQNENAISEEDDAKRIVPYDMSLETDDNHEEEEGNVVQQVNLE